MQESAMNRFIALIPAALMWTAHPARADEPQIDVPENARAVAATVDRFFAALVAGDLAGARAELDPQVVILESGGAEHSAAEYMSSHAGADAQFLKDAHQRLLRRTARAEGGLAWIATESELHVQQDGKPLRIASTETMVLRPAADGWKIAHIHWSSHVMKVE
jgi:hypothetical protein